MSDQQKLRQFYYQPVENYAESIGLDDWVYDPELQKYRDIKWIGHRVKPSVENPDAGQG